VQLPPYDNTPISKDVTIADPGFLETLRFGDGTLSGDATLDHSGGRSLKGRYIIRIGRDGVSVAGHSFPLCGRGGKLIIAH